MIDLYRERTCRVCAGELDTILDLGALHPSGFLRSEEQPLPRVPHDLCVCPHCKLVQLRHTVDPDVMFRQYWYLSGVNEVMREELADIVAKVQDRLNLTSEDLVMDIGANDGTLLSAYRPGPLKVAFEPARNLNEELHRHASVVISDYFPRGLRELTHVDHCAKVITAVACFYDLDDPSAFLKAIADTLHPEGVFIVQFQDWDQMQQANAFDNICTEHLFYPSLASLERMLEPHGLAVIDAELRKINGGSYRLWIGHKTNEWVSPNVDALRMIEEGCEAWETFDRFAYRCRAVKTQIQGFLSDTPGSIDIYGASTKFNTLAQWCGIDHRVVRQAWERSPAKFGLRTAGTNIPIVNEVVGRMDPPDVLFVGIWQFRDAVLQREHRYLAEGGTMIFSLPRVDIVRGTQHGA